MKKRPDNYSDTAGMLAYAIYINKLHLLYKNITLNSLTPIDWITENGQACQFVLHNILNISECTAPVNTNYPVSQKFP
jgi:hypothetical protein